MDSYLKFMLLYYIPAAYKKPLPMVGGPLPPICVNKCCDISNGCDRYMVLM
jgi:hypothetical protein